MSRSQQSSPLAELRTLQKCRDTPGLRQLYLREGDELARAAGVEPTRLLRLLERSDADVLQASGKVLDVARRRARQRKHDESIHRATQAAREIQRTARWRDGAVHLDIHVVVGELLAAQNRHFCFSWETQEVLVERGRLTRVRALARRLDGLSVYMTERALCFRWRGGRGGLNLCCQLPRGPAPDDVFRIELAPPQKTQPAPLPLRRFITRVMMELQHLPTT